MMILPHIIHDSHVEARNMLLFSSPTDLANKLKGRCGLGLLVNAGIMTEDTMHLYLCPGSGRKKMSRGAGGFGMSWTDYFWRYQISTGAANSPWTKLEDIKPRTVLLSDPIGLHGSYSWGNKFSHQGGLNIGRADLSVSLYKDKGNLIRDAFEPGGLFAFPYSAPTMVHYVLRSMDKNQPFPR